MATYQKPAASAFNLFTEEERGKALPQAGALPAVCIAGRDEFGVRRKKFESQDFEEVDMTSFLFEVVNPDGSRARIETMPMKQSGASNSALTKLLKAWLAAEPVVGTDYTSERQGKGALLTISLEERTNKPGEFYAKILSISPLPHGMTCPVVGGKAAKPAAGKAAGKPPATRPAVPPPPPPPEDDPANYPEGDGENTPF